jgi:hypothetical protein
MDVTRRPRLAKTGSRVIQAPRNGQQPRRVAQPDAARRDEKDTPGCHSRGAADGGRAGALFRRTDQGLDPREIGRLGIRQPAVFGSRIAQPPERRFIRQQARRLAQRLGGSA